MKSQKLLEVESKCISLKQRVRSQSQVKLYGKLNNTFVLKVASRLNYKNLHISKVDDTHLSRFDPYTAKVEPNMMWLSGSHKANFHEI